VFVRCVDFLRLPLVLYHTDTFIQVFYLTLGFSIDNNKN
jgi:hypothetical protein